VTTSRVPGLTEQALTLLLPGAALGADIARNDASTDQGGARPAGSLTTLDRRVRPAAQWLDRSGHRPRFEQPGTSHRRLRTVLDRT